MSLGRSGLTESPIANTPYIAVRIQEIKSLDPGSVTRTQQELNVSSL
jgi:hypothetical protein